ncbi:MAG: ComF family protein [Thiobacillaceae bacterium]|nr:ComF family protein [Thiobacillaceae bacterium]MCX7672960.1 ComF family protein [Thiobacillaceae bacterium]MDW8324346.1 ComF family protein [Burkholderiales bacterium]
MFLNDCLFRVQSWVRRRLPQPCVLCGARSLGSALCPGCRSDLPLLPSPRCPLCARPTPAGEVCGACLKRPPAFDRCQAALVYAPPADALIRRLKYEGDLTLAGLLAELLLDALTRTDLPAAIVPMPLHPQRLKARGFNQAVEIGRRLARRLGLPLLVDACHRVRDTPAQVGLDVQARRRNLRGAFACDEGLRGLRVALLDDVMTSGASLNELARAARRAGAAHIEAWACARTLVR